MRSIDTLEMILLAAIWGASFLFMRVAAPELGPIALAFLRVALATLCLLPILAWRRELALLKTQWLPLAVVGLLNSALPFCLYAYAALSMPAGFSSIVNATTPLWGAVIAYLWLRHPLPSSRILGLAIGFIGVVLLVWSKASFKAGGAGLAICAALLATFSYGIAANFTKQYLSGVPAMAVATGSQMYAAILLAPLAAWLWPAHAVSNGAWHAVIALAVFCTAIAYLMYFRLIAHIGPSRAIAVTFLIPLFGVAWGVIFLAEQILPAMLVGGGVILLGTSLAVGLWAVKLPRLAL